MKKWKIGGKHRKKIITVKIYKTFKYIAENIGRGNKNSLKRLYKLNEENQIGEILLNRRSIEQKLIEITKDHLAFFPLFYYSPPRLFLL